MHAPKWEWKECFATWFHPKKLQPRQSKHMTIEQKITDPVLARLKIGLHQFQKNFNVGILGWMIFAPV